MILFVLILLYLTIPHHNTPLLHKTHSSLIAIAAHLPAAITTNRHNLQIASVLTVIRKQANGVSSGGLFEHGKIIDRVGGTYEQNN